MKKSLFSALFLIAIIGLRAQTPNIGHAVLTFNDSTRTGGYGSGGGTGRQIQCEVYYPSTSPTGGDNVPITAGQYPVLVFGHGFVMAWSSYDNIWTDLVPQGYVIAFPRTEGAISPSHADFGKDLALVADRMVKEGLNPNNFLYNHLVNKTAIMGHSMGGGSSFLACANNSNVTTMVTFAAANTNPSSIAAALNVSVPTLVIAGQNDCVAPPAANQDSMYLNTASACKAEVTMKGAAHCEFANYNFNCSFGEGSCSPQPTISAGTQQSTASLYYSKWLAWFLKNDCNAWQTFNDSLAFSSAVIGIKSCSITCNLEVSTFSSSENTLLYPNPTQSEFLVKGEATNNKPFSLEIHDALGRLIMKTTQVEPGHHFDVRSLENGVYIVRISTSLGTLEKILVKS